MGNYTTGRTITSKKCNDSLTRGLCLVKHSKRMILERNVTKDEGGTTMLGLKLLADVSVEVDRESEVTETGGKEVDKTERQ